MEEAARAAQAVTEGAKPAWLVVGTAARQRRLLPGCRCQSTQASYSSTAEDAILTSEAFPGCKFAKSVINPLSILMDCSSTHVGLWLSEYVDTVLDSIDKMERLALVVPMRGRCLVLDWTAQTNAFSCSGDNIHECECWLTVSNVK